TMSSSSVVNLHRGLITVPKSSPGLPPPEGGGVPGRWGSLQGGVDRRMEVSIKERGNGRAALLPPQVGGNPDAVNRLVGFYLRGILQIRYRIETNAERLQRRENLDRAAEHSRQELGNILQRPSVRSDLRNPVLG